MGYVTPEQITQAKELDLLTYLQRFDPHELVHVSGNTYCTREHDSLKISNGKWNWFSRGIGGKTALDYLIKVQGFSFTQAVEALVGQNFSPVPRAAQAKPKEREPRMLLLPQASRCATHMVSYLHGRGIDYDVIDYCIQTGRLYESGSIGLRPAPPGGNPAGLEPTPTVLPRRRRRGRYCLNKQRICWGKFSLTGACRPYDPAK